MTDTATAPAATGDNGGGTQIGVSAAPTMDSTAASSAPTIEWLSGADTDTVGYVQNKGWKNSSDVVQSYRNLEKLRGVPADRLLTLPTDLSDSTAMGQIYDRLGRPQDAKGYTFGEVDKDVGAWAGNNFHELGLTKQQGEALMSRWDAWNSEMRQQHEQKILDSIEQDSKALKKEWGAAYDQNRAVANKAAEKLGLQSNELDAMIQAIGNKRLSEIMHKIGSGMGEDGFVGTEPGTNTSGAMTPAQATSKINQLKSDQEFTRRLLAGDVASRREWDRLHEMAFFQAA